MKPCEASFALSFGPYFCSSPRAYNILGMRQHTGCHKTQKVAPVRRFQNVSSTFARFIGGAKGDIRISQLNTSDHLLLLFRRMIKRTSVPYLLIQNKKPRFCRTHIYTRYLSRSNIHRKPNTG